MNFGKNGTLILKIYFMSDTMITNYELEKLILINYELKTNSLQEKSDYEKALNNLYENFEGYYGIVSEFDEWGTNEDGEQIKHSEKETKKFYEYISDLIYNMLIKKAFKKTNELEKLLQKEYDSGFNDGLVQAQSAMMEIGI